MRHKFLSVVAAIAALLMPSELMATTKYSPRIASREEFPLLSLVFALFGDRLDKKEVVAAGICSANIYAVLDDPKNPGKKCYVFFTSVNGSMSYSIAFDGSIAIQPIPIINTSHAPRWYDFDHQSQRGYRKLWRIPVRGAGPIKDQKFTDNAGFVDPQGNPTVAPITEVGTLPMGVNAFSVSWGTGQAATLQFVRVEWGQFFGLYGNMQARTGVHGAGNAAYPQVPSFFGVDEKGNVLNFATVEELKHAMGSANDKDNEEVSTQVVADNRVTEEENEPKSKNRQERIDGIQLQYGYAPTGTRLTDEEVQAKVARATESKLLSSGTIAERRGHKTYVHLRSTSAFRVELHRERSSSPWRSSAKVSGNGYEIAFKATLAAGDRIEVIDDQNRRTMLTVVGEEG